MIGDRERQAAADALAVAEREAVPIEPPTESWPGLDPTDAYAVQLLNARNRIGAGGVVRGHKVGLTSRPMQQMLGVDEPDYGHLFDDMFVVEGESLEAAAFCHPRVEIEVAFVLQDAVAGPGITVADVIRNTAFVLPAIEVIDSRVRDWRITLADTIADNASSARVVLGGKPTPLAAVDVRVLGGIMRRRGEIVETGASGAVLGNPVTAVAWLANKLADFDDGLEAGHVVLSGACTRAIDVEAGDAIRADFDVLGSVEVRFR